MIGLASYAALFLAQDVRAEEAAFRNSEVLRACVSTSSYVSGVTVAILEPDLALALNLFADAQNRYGEDVKFFSFAAGPHASQIISSPVGSIQFFSDAANECSENTKEKCVFPEIKDQARFVNTALKLACSADFNGGVE